jgi:hypothetical protein
MYPNKFPFVPPVAGSSPNFAPLTPFSLSQYNPAFRSPYSENVQFTIADSKWCGISLTQLVQFELRRVSGHFPL